MRLREGDVFGDRIRELHFAAINQGQESTGHQGLGTAMEFAEAPRPRHAEMECVECKLRSNLPLNKDMRLWHTIITLYHSISHYLQL